MAAGRIVQPAGCALGHDPASYYASNAADCKDARPASGGQYRRNDEGWVRAEYKL